jgi:signal transduction histidine kinase
VLISNKINKFHEEDAQRSVKEISQKAFDGFNSWKLRLWKGITKLVAFSNVSDNIEINSIVQIASDSGADFVIFFNKALNNINIYHINENDIKIFNNINMFVEERIYPYVKSIVINDNLILIGVCNIDQNIVCLGKKLDENFIKQINNETKAETILQFGIRNFIGINTSNIIHILNERPQKQIYTLYNDIAIDHEHYNAVIQLAGKAYLDNESIPITMITLVSKKKLITRLKELQFDITLVTIFCSLLTIILSLVFSERIVLPIKELVYSMSYLKKGQFLLLNSIKGYFKELNDLVNVYNEMANTLELDKIQKENILRFNSEVLNSLDEAVVVIGNDENEKENKLDILFINNAFFKIFKQSNNNVINIEINNLLSFLRFNDINEFFLYLKNYDISKNNFILLEDKRTIEIKVNKLNIASEGKDKIKKWVLVIEDITNRVAYEEKIIQAEKLASLSILSAGVAHEINNPLAAILTNVQNLIMDDENKDSLDTLKIIEQETRRIAKIVRELLDFSSSHNNTINETDAEMCLQNVINLVNYYLVNKKNINIHLDIEKNIPYLLVDEDSLKQILINIIKNSFQAIEYNGDIWIKLYKKDCNYVEINIKDNGKGISPKILNRIFDPFFTTKEDGIGMGLSIVYGILKRCGGDIFLESKEGYGTTVKLIIPIKRSQ